MAAQPQERVRKRLVWFSPYLLAVAVLSQTSTPLSCAPTGDTTLSSLELEVQGTNQIAAFDSAKRAYDVWLPVSASSATLRATSTDPGAQVLYNLRNSGGFIQGGWLGIGFGQLTFNLPVGRSSLNVSVKAPGGATGTYSLNVNVGCSQCSDGNECTYNNCDPVTQTCVHPPIADGNQCDTGDLPGVCISGTCDPSVFPCTEQGIRDAIARGGGPFTFACNGPTTIVTQDEIFIDNDVILDGEGNLTVDGNDDHRVLSVVPDVTVDLVGMTVSGGFLNFEGAQGAGILNEGTLTITNCNISWNGTVQSRWGNGNGGGGGIYNSGTLMLESTTVQDNYAGYGEGSGIYTVGVATLVSSRVSHNGYNYNEPTSNGSGIFNNSGTLTLIDSTVSLNSDGSGDAAAIDSHSATLLLVNSVVSENISLQSGSILFSGSATVVNSTVSGNVTASSSISGIEGYDGTLTLINSTVVPPQQSRAVLGGYRIEMIVANSIIVGDGVDGTCELYPGFFSVISGGGNIESTTNDCGLTHPTDLVDVTSQELNLDPLADNGGPTMTHALLPGSVAIDRIPPSMCVDADGQPLTTDQRGVARPQGSACDVGAFESQCSGVDCDDGNECTVDACDPTDGLCANDPVADGSACDFGGLPGVCIAGLCQEDVCAGVDCNDGNECTADVCDSTAGTCTNDPVANGTSCDFVGLAGVCVDGACASAQACALAKRAPRSLQAAIL